jgi:AcrR family transcriptional regulator
MVRNLSGPQSDSPPGDNSLSPDGRPELPVLGNAVVAERADAARNRLRVLAAAERLFAERGVAGVTMDDIARVAGVGKGTLYRRFVDKGGLAVALLDEREKELQGAILTGPPPLGPGAEPAERLAAFVDAYLNYLVRQLDIVLMSETSAPGARLRTGAHNFWHRHCHLLLEASAAPEPALTADVLLAALSAEQVRHWVIDDGRPLEQIAAYFAALLRILTLPGT